MLTIAINEKSSQAKSFLQYIKTLPFIKFIETEKTISEKEDEGLIKLMKEADRSEKVSREKVMSKLLKK